MSPEWMIALDGQAKDPTGKKAEPMADPLERMEWAKLDRVSRFLAWCVARATAGAHGYTRSQTRSISRGLCDTVPVKKAG
ncbi:hypothetical protein [Pararhizobium antarcticum]|uniref:Uncharacterized protein n=1 Tax=Pararhizobium antarcticum TaxID=1798805 RepID=A0A657LQH7_9HYPH|nr:hypothetical protein [Pararhizobium antarcticum]OJF93438.1 hypothetical protein AX760_05405 [Pararhizobium antarcticum]OJG00458.1 hypothetical protein AX761_08565 [Rhizobium sp. 58]